MTDAVRRALEFAAEHMHSDWPERCQEIVRRARAALSEQPAVDPWRPFGLTLEAALNRGDDPALLMDENSPLRDELRRLLAGQSDEPAVHPAPVERVAWQSIETAPEDATPFLAWIDWFDGPHAHTGRFKGGEFWPDFRDSASKKPSHWMPLPASPNVIAEYERLNGISATPRQPLSEAQIAAVLRKASERAGFVTLEAGEPSAFMVGVVRDVEAAHGITPAQGKGGE